MGIITCKIGECYSIADNNELRDLFRVIDMKRQLLFIFESRMSTNFMTKRNWMLVLN
jgi:hypothetical protein